MGSIFQRVQLYFQACCVSLQPGVESSGLGRESPSRAGSDCLLLHDNIVVAEGRVLRLERKKCQNKFFSSFCACVVARTAEVRSGSHFPVEGSCFLLLLGKNSRQRSGNLAVSSGMRLEKPGGFFACRASCLRGVGFVLLFVV